MELSAAYNCSASAQLTSRVKPRQNTGGLRPPYVTFEKERNMTTNPNHASARLPRIHLDKTLVGRLETLAASVMRRSPEVGERLIDEIARAKRVAPEKMRDDVVTLGSKVTYRDLSVTRLHTVSDRK